ncbi:MAG: hypothetical protein ACLQU5_14375, partial [Isosphaeraceae bacterium]
MSALSVPCVPVVAGRLTGPGRRMIAIAETRIKARRLLESPTHPRPALNFGMVQKQVTPRGGWGRRPKGDAPRSEAFALGARWLSPARPQPP